MGVITHGDYLLQVCHSAVLADIVRTTHMPLRKPANVPDQRPAFERHRMVARHLNSPGRTLIYATPPVCICEIRPFPPSLLSISRYTSYSTFMASNLQLIVTTIRLNDYMSRMPFPLPVNRSHCFTSCDSHCRWI